MWPVGYAHCQTRTRNILLLLLPCKDCRLSLRESSCQSLRSPFSRSQTVGLCGEEHCPHHRNETEVPLDVGGPPVINSSATTLPNIHAKNTMRDPKDNAGVNWHVSEWHNYYQIFEPVAEIWTNQRPRFAFKSADPTVLGSGRGSIRAKMTRPLSHISVTVWARRNFGTGFTQQTT